MSERLRELLSRPEFNERYWARRCYHGGDVIFKEGDDGVSVYVVLRGNVRVSASINIEGGRQIQPGFSDLGEGEVFGELALFDRQPRSATVVAIDEVELAEIDGGRLLRFFDEHPELGYPIVRELTNTMVGRLRKANQRVFSLFAWGLKARGIDDHL